MPKSKDSSVQVAVIVAGLLAVIGGAWVFLNSGNDEAIETTQVASVTKKIDNVPSAVSKMPVDTALQMAELAFQSGHLTGDEEGTATDFYRQVLDQEPDNARAKAGLQLISIQLVDEADEMIAKGNYEEVVQRLKALNRIEAGSDSVLALQAKLTEKSSGIFAQLDKAIASGKLDQAEQLANTLRRIPDSDAGRISAAVVSIAQERKAREAAAVAAAAKAAEQIEPTDIPSTESFAVSTNTRFNDRSDISSSNTSGSSGFSQTAQAVDPIQTQIETLLSQATSMAEQNRLTSPQGNNALELYNQVLAMESTNAEAKRGLRGIVQKLTSRAYELADAGNVDDARSTLDQAEGVGIATPLVAQARTDVRKIWIESETQKVFAVGGFEVEKSVAPQYPKRAMSRSIEGWVKVEFVVTENGQTQDIKVIESSERLAKQFGKSALTAVKQWRFKPRVLDGQVVAQRSQTTVQFKLSN